MPKSSGEALLGTGILSRKYLKHQALLSSLICLAGTLFFCFLPSFPFDRRIGYFTFVAFVFYAVFFFLVDRLRGSYYHIITALSVFAMLGVTFIVHMTGGISSPFVFFYFVILISEAAYGVEQYFSIGAAAIMFTAVIAAEYFGALSVSESARAVYASPPTTLILGSTTVAFMFITGLIGRLIIKQLRMAIEEESHEKQAVMSKLTELECHSQIGILAHRIAHDLRAPISSISGYVQMEMLKRKNAEDAAALRDINDVISGMVESLRGITQFGKTASRPPERISLSEFLRMLQAIITYSPQARGVIFRRAFHDSLGIHVNASRADLQQALFNVLRNAVEAVRENAGERLITIGLKQDGEEAEVSVTDNGPGMPPEIMKTLFRKSITTKKDGTGVGLIITRDLLLRNDGDIQFFNLPEGGLRAVMRFPLA